MFEGVQLWGLGSALFQKLLSVESSILTRSRHETGAHVRCNLQGLSSLAWLISSITIITSTIIAILTVIVTVFPKGIPIVTFFRHLLAVLFAEWCCLHIVVEATSRF